MKKYVMYENKNEMIGVIVLSHGTLALSILDTAALIAGGIDKCAGIALEAGDDPEEFRQTFEEVYEDFGASIVFVDLMAGPPFNQVCMTSRVKEEKMYVVSGVNVPMMLEVLTSRGKSTPEQLQKMAVDAGKRGVANITEWLENLSKHK